MTIKELMTKLETLPQDALILCDLAYEGAWTPLENVECFDGMELRFADQAADSQPAHYCRTDDPNVDAKWTRVYRPMVHFYGGGGV